MVSSEGACAAYTSTTNSISSQEKNMPDDQPTVDMQGAVCPIPASPGQNHRNGSWQRGKMMHDLIKTVFASAFDNPILTAGTTPRSRPTNRGTLRHQHRLACGQTAFLPRWGYWQIGSVRYGQRCCHAWCLCPNTSRLDLSLKKAYP